jgi:hypothetical protein
VQLIGTNERVLGVEHPSTLTNVGNLAVAYVYQERWQLAEKLGVRVMVDMKKVLGAEHPETLTSIVNLASMYKK